MKKMLFWAGMLLAVSVLAVACDDDNDDNAVCPLVEAVTGVYDTSIEITQENRQPVDKNATVGIVADGDEVDISVTGFEFEGVEVPIVLDDVDLSGNGNDVRMFFNDKITIAGYGNLDGTMTGSVRNKTVLDMLLKITVPTSFGRTVVAVRITGNKK